MPEVTVKQWDKRHCAHEILDNMKETAESTSRFMSLMHTLDDGGYSKAAGLVREIISDEKNHLLILQGLLQEFDGDIPVANGDVQEALQKLKNAIKKDEV